ncbi:MAG: class I SAM-dependent methyltransferase [Patescibacteria group bacterium]
MKNMKKTIRLSKTAVGAWNKRWATDEGRVGFTEPHSEVLALVPELKRRGARSVLDLGCGVGRHSLALADAGFDVQAMDGSATGLKVLRQNAAVKGLSLQLRQGDADSLPFADSRFDYVLAWDVIYHGNLGDVGHRVAKIWRVLKPGGLFQGTLLSTRHKNYRVGREVAPNTFVEDNEDRGHSHFYCDASDIVVLFTGFELLKLGQHIKRRPGSWHWNIVAERLKT